MASIASERYELIRELDEGGMARVYLAKDTHTDLQVIIKVPNVEDASPESFLREARNIAALSDHPNVVRILDLGMAAGTEPPRPFLVFEYLARGDLKGYAGNMSPDAVLQMAIQIADALSYAHEHGIAHRDLKPRNIFSSSASKFKLGDFGI